MFLFVHPMKLIVFHDSSAPKEWKKKSSQQNTILCKYVSVCMFSILSLTVIWKSWQRWIFFVLKTSTCGLDTKKERMPGSGDWICFAKIYFFHWIMNLYFSLCLSSNIFTRPILVVTCVPWLLFALMFLNLLYYTWAQT